MSPRWLNTKKALALFIFILSNAGTVLTASEITLTSQVSKTKVKVGEKFSFTITLSGSYKQTPRMKIPNLSEFIVISSRQSSKYNVREGKTVAITKYEFILAAKKSGIFTIQAVELDYNNKIYKTQPLDIEISEGTSPQEETPSPDEKRIVPFNKERGIIL